KRDVVGLIAFRGDAAEELLPPTRSAVFAYRRLAELPAGGRTPLAAGLARALEVIAREQSREAALAPCIVLITDGRATSPGGSAFDDALVQARRIAAQKISVLCIDTEDGPVRLGQAARVAREMDAG